MRTLKLLTFIFTLALVVLLNSSNAKATDFVIDTAKAHAFIEFKVSHLGYSWLLGRFDTFEGEFEYDPKKPSKSKVEVVIDTASVNTNHSERDKHLRSEDFLNSDKHPESTFKSTKFKDNGDGTFTMTGNFTLNGVTKEIDIAVTKIGEGKDPWGGYRAGFEGSTSFKMKDYNIKKYLGPASETVHLYFSIEGIKKK